MSQFFPEEPDSVKAHRSIVFHGTRWAVFALCVVGALAAAQYFAGDRWAVLRTNVYLLALLFWGWGSTLATWLCRVLGLSLAGNQVERIERTGGGDVEANHSAPFTIIRDKFATFVMPVCTTLLCAFCFGPTLFTYALPSPDWVRILILTLIFSSLLAVAIFTWVHIHKPAIKIDAQGVSYCDALGFQSRFVAWAQIDSGEVVRVHNVFGEVTREFIVLRDKKHKKLMTLRFDSRSKEENRSDLERTAEQLREWLSFLPSTSEISNRHE